MWLSLAALLIGAAPGEDQAGDLFKRMERQILMCKTLQVQLEITDETTKNLSLRGRLAVAQGNKIRLVLDGTLGAPGVKLLMVSDGTTVHQASFGLPSPSETPKRLNELLLGSVARTGVLMPHLLPGEHQQPGLKFDLAKEFPVSDLKLGKKETVSGRETQVLEYKIARKPPLAVTLWIDVKTNLPVKRVITDKEGQEKSTVTEIYTKVVLDEKIDDKEFESPK